MRVLLISPTLGGIGGIGSHVSHLKKWLLRKNIQVDVLSSNDVRIIRIKGMKNLSFMISAIFKTYGKEYDIIHAHNVPAALPMKFAKGKKILTLHGVYSKYIRITHGNLYSYIAKKMESKLLRYADKLTAVSEKVIKYYKKMGFDAIYIPNAIDLEDIPETSKKIYDKQVVYAGRLSKEKGLDILIEAFKQIDNVHLIVIGKGPLRETLMKQAKGHDNIHFLGFLKDHREVLEYIKGSDIYVQPSRIEGLSTSILEAMACQVPVIATKVEGNVEVIKDGITGLLVEPENIKSLKDSIIKLIEDKKKANYLATNAYREILKRYNWDVVSNQYIKLYNILVS
ncbi:MAG: glycosyltransferase family 4 protein [Thermoproteales archaeon]|nr:glycosyltransferase family 4 protein [Thermoproteales archaeon]